MHFTEREHTHTHTIFRERTHTHTQYLQRQERESARTHNIYRSKRESTRAHTHIFYKRGDNAQNIPMRTYRPQSSNKKTACKVRAPHLRKPLGYFVCDGLKGMWPSSITSITAAFPLQLRRSRAYTKCQRMDATIDDSHKAKNVHQHTHTIYFTERERARTHTHHI